MLVRTKADCGFSLTELLLVLAVITVVASLSLPAFRGTMSSYRLKASADLIAGELDAARVMAISRGTIYEVRIAGSSVRVIDPQDEGNPPRIEKFLEEGVTVDGTRTITFQPRGTATEANIRLQNETGEATIDVTRTGRIEVKLSGKEK